MWKTANDDSINKSESREDLWSDDVGFTQEYFVYCKKRRRSQGAKHPGGAEVDGVSVCPGQVSSPKKNHAAVRAARELAVKYQTSRVVDMILCLDGTEVLGICLAEELIAEGVGNENEHNTLYVVTPETTSGNQQIFRENIAHLIRNRHVLILAASLTTGTTALEAIQAVRYYGGVPVGVCCIFSCIDTCDGFPVTSLFQSKILGDYRSVSASQCPLCKAGVRIDALVNSYGISSFL